MTITTSHGAYSATTTGQPKCKCGKCFLYVKVDPMGAGAAKAGLNWLEELGGSRVRGRSGDACPDCSQTTEQLVAQYA